MGTVKKMLEQPPENKTETETRERQRQTAAAANCPECKQPAFVASSPRSHPHFVQTERARYYKCGSCGYRFKG